MSCGPLVNNVLADCPENAPGVYNLLLVQASDVVSIPEPDSGTITISDNIVLKSGKQWSRYQFEPETGGLKIDGEKGTWKAEMSMKVMEHGETVDYAISSFVGKKLIALVEDGNGSTRLLGTKRQFCMLKAALDTGTKGGDEGGWTGTLTLGFQPHVPYHYAGAAAVQADPS